MDYLAEKLLTKLGKLAESLGKAQHTKDRAKILDVTECTAQFDIVLLIFLRKILRCQTISPRCYSSVFWNGLKCLQISMKNTKKHTMGWLRRKSHSQQKRNTLSRRLQLRQATLDVQRGLIANLQPARRANQQKRSLRLRAPQRHSRGEKHLQTTH